MNCLNRLITLVVFTVWLPAIQASAAGPIADGVQEGDLFVGAASYYNSFDQPSGPRGIFRVRDGVSTPFSMGPASSSNPDFFYAPEDVIVDAQGRVVWLAELGSGSPNNHIGLFRATGIGATPEKLAIFRVGSHALNPGYPNPFPDLQVSSAIGLHLASHRRVEIDDNVDDGQPRVVTEEAYVLGLNHATGDSTVSYGAITGVWDTGLPDPIYSDRWSPNDMISHAGAIYSIDENGLRRASTPLRLEASGSIDLGPIGHLEFNVGLRLFGGNHDVRSIVIDDTRIPNVPSGVPPEYPNPPNHDQPWEGAWVPLSGLEGLTYDRQLGLVIRSTHASDGPYLTRISDKLLNDDPRDDLEAYFWRRATGGGWEAVPSLELTRMFAIDEPIPGSSNGRPHNIVSYSRGGLVGVGNSDSIVNVTEGGINVLATGLVDPQSVGTYPTYASPATGLSVIIRVDSSDDVIVTSPDGRRLGVDPVTGLLVNDFGETGFDSGPGEPRFFGIRDSAPGEWKIETTGITDGPFAINVYGIDLDKTLGTRSRWSGKLSPGSRATALFRLDSTADVQVFPPGDLNKNGVVDRSDVALFAAHFGVATDSSWMAGDFDGDRQTTLADLAILQSNLGDLMPIPHVPQAAVPEPTALALAMLAALCLVLYCRTLLAATRTRPVPYG